MTPYARKLQRYELALRTIAKGEGPMGGRLTMDGMREAARVALIAEPLGGDVESWTPGYSETGVDELAPKGGFVRNYFAPGDRRPVLPTGYIVDDLLK